MPGIEQPALRPDPGSAAPVATDLAVILPAFNEAQGIESTLARVGQILKDFPFSSEIIVVDDGSTDGTGERAASAGARVVTHAWNRGYGAALKTGILATRASAVMIMDADATYEPGAIPRLYARLDGAAMVVGTRWLRSEGVAMILSLSSLPPSVNAARTIHKRGKKRFIGSTDAYRNWIEAMAWDVCIQRGPQRIEGPFRIEFTVTRPDKRKRDADNLLKGAMDAVVKGGAVEDDSLADDIRIKWIEDGQPGMSIVITPARAP